MRLESGQAVATQRQDHPAFALDVRIKLDRTVADSCHFGIDPFDRFRRHACVVLACIFIFENDRVSVIGCIELFDARQLLAGVNTRWNGHAVQAFDKIVADIDLERRLDPSKTLLCCNARRCLLHLCGREIFQKRDIKPGFIFFIVEQFAVNPSACCDIGVLADQFCTGITAA